MELLRTLTLIYAAVLVLALAASLITIWLYLRRIGGVLEDVRAALGATQRETAPMESLFEPLGEALGGCGDTVRKARSSLEHANERLGALAERAGAGEPAR